MKQTPDFSLIIPCYRDDAALKQVLLQLDALRGRDGTPSYEVIIVDGGNCPASKALAIVQGARYLAGEACRGQQLRAGAKAATGRTLWFLHADAVITEATVAALVTACAAGKKAGYFQFSFAGTPTLMQRALAGCVNLRARFGGVPYGDQAIFVERTLYWQAGGHQPIPLFEEVTLVRQLRKISSCAALPQVIGVDPRKWQASGYISRTLHNRLYALAFMVGYPVEKLAARYQQPRKPG